MTFSNYKMDSQDISGCYFSHVPHNYEATLEDLLQARDVTPLNDKTGLSPNGIFKYFDRELSKSSSQKYGRYMKSQRSSEKRIRRPLNCFMVFSHLERKRVADEHPELHNADLSKILGKRWKSLTSSERQPYIAEAERIRQLHTEMYPDYKYQPRRKTQNKKGVKKADETEMKKGENDEKEEVEDKVDEKSNKEETSMEEKVEHNTSQKSSLEKGNNPEKKVNSPIFHNGNTPKIDFSGKAFPDYRALCFHEKQNNDYLFDRHYSNQGYDQQFEHSTPSLNPLHNLNIQTRENIPTPNRIQYYDFNENSQSYISDNQDIRNEMTFRNKQVIYPTYCKENVKAAIDMNIDTSYLVENHYGNYNNDFFNNQCAQNYMNSHPLDEFIENDYPKEMRLMKGELTASFTNIVESLQNIN